MKKLALLSLGLMITLASCEEKEEDKTIQTPPSELILGTWDLDKIHYVEFENGQKVDEDYDSDYLQLIFTSNTYWMTEGTQDTIDFGSYTLTADSLILNGDDGGRFQLNKLTKTELEFYFEDEYTYDSTHYRDEITVYFEK